MRDVPTTDQLTPSEDEGVLLDWLANRDTPCPLCEYNLRGLTSPRCPECGQAVRLAVSLVEPYLKAWVALLTALLPPAGFGSFFLIAMAREQSLRELRHTPFWGALTLLYIVICIPLSLLVLARRRPFLRLSRPVQQMLAVTAWVTLMVTLISVVYQMR